ncbi:hypothetical protein BASA50_008002 [Batrachochytrium salamandrivorans]|uniref:Uncharacterized protein n=1 Tax=Batrachochytrium salamandrivorans TaxID=1357716 RepID=A0ABQ8F5E5_9FUNG|nr:hypothetical protein BASA62_005162 [Batrachochytrium salamandrivorans]KAH6592552.1 hypothetical protein BASA50_008002 [Batrachochytrium salamandrivorans]
MRLIAPFVMLSTGIGYLVLLIVLHEPAYPVATMLCLLDIRAALPLSYSRTADPDKALHVGLIPSVDRSLLLWVLSDNDDPRNPSSRLISQRLYVGQAAGAALKEPFSSTIVAKLEPEHIYLIVNDTFSEATKYILTDDAGSQFPTITLVTNWINGEESIYDARVYALESPSKSDPGLVRFVRARVPGSLTFSRLSYGNPSTLVYSRKNDVCLFRVISDLVPKSIDSSLRDSGDIGGESPSMRPKSYPGPFFQDYPGRVLSVVSLFTKDPSETLLFVFQYRSLQDKKRFRIYVSLFSQILDGPWKRYLLWEKDWHGLGEDAIAADELHLLYFLTDPIVVTSGLSKTVLFVFMQQLFTLDYIQDIVTSTVADARVTRGYLFTLQAIPFISGADLEIGNMHIDTPGRTLVLSSNRNRVFILKRKPIEYVPYKTDQTNNNNEQSDASQTEHTLPLPVPSHISDADASAQESAQADPIKDSIAYIERWLSSFFMSFEVIQFFMDAFWDYQEVNSRANINEGNPVASTPLLFGDWELSSYWSSADYVQHAPRKIEAVTLLEAPGRDLVVVLLGKDRIAIIDDTIRFQGMHAIRFLLQHAMLTLVLSFVTGMFTINEFRPDVIPRSNMIFMTTIYMLVLSIIISVLIDEI